MIPAGIKVARRSTSMRQGLRQKPIQVPVAYRRVDPEEPGWPGLGWTEDLGEGGACLRLSVTLPVGCRLKLVLFTHPTRVEPVETEGRVTWVEARAPGGFHHGVEFLQVNPAHLDVLRQLLLRKQSEGQVVRLQVTLPVHCQVKGVGRPPLRGRTENVSSTGVMISMPEALSPGTQVELRFEGNAWFGVDGEVRWVDPPGKRSGSIRHGIAFRGDPLSSQQFQGLLLGVLPEKHQGIAS